MITPSYFISDEAVFGKLRKDLELAVRLDVRLPKVLFKQSIQVIGFEEFDWAMSDEFWPVLQLHKVCLTIAKKLLILIQY